MDPLLAAVRILQTPRALSLGPRRELTFGTFAALLASWSRLVLRFSVAGGQGFHQGRNKGSPERRGDPHVGVWASTGHQPVRRQKGYLSWLE